MRLITLSYFLSILFTFGKCSVIRSSEIEDDIARFKNEDTKIFEGQGLWFYDDNGNLVQATLNKSLLSSEANLRINIEENVSFLLYTREEEEPFVLNVGDKVTLAESNFNPKKSTKLITHGWISSSQSPACSLIKDAFLEQGDYNVIVIDWRKIANSPYVMASWNVKNVARYVSSMIDFLETMGMDPSKTTLIGHSLGAHVMGLAGHFSVNTINYIIGLDPALPLFGSASEGSRISANDATNVEIIHTNAGLLGYKNDIGHVDFYPNGGSTQFGCISDVFGICSHRRAFQFYAESILSNDGFYGKKCDDYKAYQENKCDDEIALMGGLKKNLKNKGKFFLHTKDKTPFAVGLE